jgi:hypothetical protein
MRCVWVSHVRGSTNGANDFIVPFTKGDGTKIYAMRYDAVNGSWYCWSNTGWAAPTNPCTSIGEEPSGGISSMYSVAVSTADRRVHFFVPTGYDWDTLRCYDYNHASMIWTTSQVPITLQSAAVFVAVDISERIWVAYKNTTNGIDVIRRNAGVSRARPVLAVRGW